MAKIAIDIALIPPETILEELIAINRALITNRQEIVLNKDSYLPHCSVAMGIIEEEKIPELWEKITTIATATKPLTFTAHEIQSHQGQGDGIKISGTYCDKTAELQNFHEQIMAISRSYMTFDDANLSMFVPSPFLTEIAAGYIKNFWRKKSGVEYAPHITMGLGEPKTSNLPLNFSFSRIALCHCGAYTTCAKILHETILAR